MPGVVRVLHHLGDLVARADLRRIEARIEGFEHRLRRMVARREHHLRRIVEVPYRCALAQELRKEARPDVVADRLPGRGFERGDHEVAKGARKHRAAHDDGEEVLLVAKRGADLLAYPLDVAEVEIAVGAARRADADDRHLAVADRGRAVPRGAQRP